MNSVVVIGKDFLASGRFAGFRPEKVKPIHSLALRACMGRALFYELEAPASE